MDLKILNYSFCKFCETDFSGQNSFEMTFTEFSNTLGNENTSISQSTDRVDPAFSQRMPLQRNNPLLELDFSEVLVANGN